MAAKEKYGNEIDVTKQLVKDGNGGESARRIAAPFRESDFHNGLNIGEDRLDMEDIYM